jgi:polyisoprenoid-binding protein YceI
MITCSALLCALMPAYARAQSAGAGFLNMAADGESKMWIDGTSTVKSFTCRATVLTAALTTNPLRPNLAIQDLVNAGELSIPVAKLDCGNGTMNDHMRKALKATTHEFITFRLVSYEALEGANMKIVGKLTIAGKENDIEIPATALDDGTGKLRLQGQKEIRMTEYGVKPPSLMLGAMKVRDPVVVHFNVLFTPCDPPAGK